MKAAGGTTAVVKAETGAGLSDVLVAAVVAAVVAVVVRTGAMNPLV